MGVVKRNQKVTVVVKQFSYDFPQSYLEGTKSLSEGTGVTYGLWCKDETISSVLVTEEEIDNHVVLLLGF